MLLKTVIHWPFFCLYVKQLWCYCCVDLHQGPHLSLSVPSVDLGLLSLGDQAQSKVTILNPSQLEACWTLRELANNLSDKDTQVPSILMFSVI